MAHLPEHLLAGYRNFMSGLYASEGTRYRSLAREGQAPETMMIACCDSRAAPEMIFDAGPGELFVMRNVANLVPPYAPDGEYHSTSAALEFAVQSLKVKHIVVMGHGRCGGIKAALNADATPLSPGDFIGKWMSLIAPAAEAVSGLDHDDRPANGRRRWSASPSATPSPTCAPFPASRSSKARAGSRCTAPGSTSRRANSG